MDCMIWQTTFGNGVPIGIALITIVNRQLIARQDRVLRGGSWKVATDRLRVASRDRNISPYARALGFDVCQDPLPLLS